MGASQKCKYLIPRKNNYAYTCRLKHGKICQGQRYCNLRGEYLLDEASKRCPAFKIENEENEGK